MGDESCKKGRKLSRFNAYSHDSIKAQAGAILFAPLFKRHAKQIIGLLTRYFKNKQELL